MKTKHITGAFAVLCLAAATFSTAFAHEDRNNMTHWHSGNGSGDNEESPIHCEIYPDGTAYINYMNNRWVIFDDGNSVDCNKDMAACKEALEEARESGPPVKSQYYQQGSPANAVSVRKMARGNRHLEKFLTKISRQLIIWPERK